MDNNRQQDAELEYSPMDSDQDTPIKYHSLQDLSASQRAKMKKNRRSIVDLDTAVSSSFKITLLQVLIALGTSLSLLSPGMALGFSAVALPQLAVETTIEPFNEEKSSWFASISNIATPVGCLVSGWMLERVGRKYSLVLLNVPCILGWLLLATAEAHWALFMGRICTGLALGLATAATNVYLAEVIKPALRGVLLCWNSVSIAVGILLVYVLGSAMYWRYAAGAGIVPAVIALIAACLMPDSPSWLLSHSKKAKAELALISLRGGAGAEVREEYQELLRAQEQRDLGPSTAGWRNLSSALRMPQFWKPLLIMNIFFAFQQFSGIFVVIFYAVDVVQEAGVSMDKYLATIFIGVARLVVTILVSIAMRKFGRRPLAILSGAGMALCMIPLAVHLYFTNGLEVVPLSWLPTVCILVYIMTSTMGFLTLPWVMVGEVFPADLRGIGGGLTTCFAYLVGFAVLKAYPGMRDVIHASGVFLVYGIVSLLGTAFVAIWLPETAGKTLAQVEQYFAGPEAMSVDSLPVMTSSKPLLVRNGDGKAGDAAVVV